MPHKRSTGLERAQLELTIDAATPAIYGCAPLFNLDAQDALLSLSFAGADPFLDWLAWQPTNECLIHRYFLNFVRSADGGTGAVADPCDDAQTFEYDICDFTLTDFARLRRKSPVRDITKVGLKYTFNQPRYRLDGSPIVNDIEFDYRLATEVLLQDLRRMVVSGDASTPAEFDGLKQLIKTGYTDSDGSECPMMDSIVIDWNGNGTDGGSGATWNGAAIADTASLIDALIAAFRRIRSRIRMSPTLAAQRLTVGSIILVLPDDFVNCILDAYTCWSVCGGNNELLTTYEARTFRNNLLGGQFGAGQITIDNFVIPLMPYDWELINDGGNNFDMFLLTGNVGNIKTLHGQVNDFSAVPGLTDQFAIDGGNILVWENYDQTCVQRFVEMQPRLMNWAPWAQARIADVSCDVIGGILSHDPQNTYFPY